MAGRFVVPQANRIAMIRQMKLCRVRTADGVWMKGVERKKHLLQVATDQDQRVALQVHAAANETVASFLRWRYQDRDKFVVRKKMKISADSNDAFETSLQRGNGGRGDGLERQELSNVVQIRRESDLQESFGCVAVP